MLRYRIEQDNDPINPRKDYDHAGTMVCWHRDYDLGDEQTRCDPDDWAASFANDLLHEQGRRMVDWDDVQDWGKHVWAIINKHAVILPLYLYEHSGITISTGKFSCPWDSGQVGYIYMTRATVEKEFGGFGEHERERAKLLLKCEVQEYDQYLTGDVWGVTIEECEGAEDEDDRGDKWEWVDSCWGFYGYKYAQETAAEMLQNAEQQRQEALDALAHVA